jgi:hypothetical protein
MKLGVSFASIVLVISLGGLAGAADLPGSGALVAEASTAPLTGAPLGEECKGGSAFESHCTADCGDYPDVSCDGASCSAVNRNCSVGQQGYVVCDSSYTYCPECPECTNGEYMCDVTDWECWPGRWETDVYKCINEHWVFQYSTCRFPSECLG